MLGVILLLLFKLCIWKKVKYPFNSNIILSLKNYFYIEISNLNIHAISAFDSIVLEFF